MKWVTKTEVLILKFLFRSLTILTLLVCFWTTAGFRYFAQRLSASTFTESLANADSWRSERKEGGMDEDRRVFFIYIYISQKKPKKYTVLNIHPVHGVYGVYGTVHVHWKRTSRNVHRDDQMPLRTRLWFHLSGCLLSFHFQQCLVNKYEENCYWLFKIVVQTIKKQ